MTESKRDGLRQPVVPPHLRMRRKSALKHHDLFVELCRFPSAAEASEAKQSEAEPEAAPGDADGQDPWQQLEQRPSERFMRRQGGGCRDRSRGEDVCGDDRRSRSDDFDVPYGNERQQQARDDDATPVCEAGARHRDAQQRSSGRRRGDEERDLEDVDAEISQHLRGRL